MAKKDYKDTVVLDPIMDEEIDEVIVENERVAEEREKAEAMNRDELIAYLLQTKENLWSSHDERDLLGGKIKERDQKHEEKIKEKDQELEEKNEKIRNLEIKVSDSKKEIINLKEQNAKKDSKIDSLTSQAKESSNLKEQISVLQQQLRDKEDAANVMEDNFNNFHKVETDKLNKAIADLKDDLKESKAENKKLKNDLKEAKVRAESFEKSFGVARDANFAGMIVRDIPREMGVGFESADEQTEIDLEELMAVIVEFMTKLKKRYTDVACGTIEAADAKILSQETAADELKKAEKELEDSESLSELAIQRREAAQRKVEEARRAFVEAKDEA